MQRNQFYTAIGVVDKFFNTSSPEVSDGILDMDEHTDICARAQVEVRGVFPGSSIMVIPARDISTDFAGYTIIVEDKSGSFEETLQFDFKSYDIDVV